ncbi:MAG: hypothetical protein ACKV2U_06420 [Bryobacteraceae bacterium]
MSDQSFATRQVHLHWVRETPSRALELPVSKTLHTLESLPPCVQTAVRATGLQSVELHLPPYRPAYYPDFSAWLAGLQFRNDAVGRLIATSADDADPLASMAYHQAIVLVLRAISGDATPLTIVAEPACSPLLRQPLATRHRCAPQGGLVNAPAERSRDYHRTYKPLSIALQWAIRETLPPARVESTAQFADRDHTLALLSWSAAQPVVGRYVDQLGVDVFSKDMLDRAYAGLPRRLADRLAEVRDILGRHGVDPAVRDSYKPSQAAEIAQHCRVRARFLYLLFCNEFRLISAFVQFCARIPAWRERGAANPALVFREVRDAWEDLETLIRRFYQRHRHSSIGSRMLMEAVRTLEAVD